MTDVQWAETRTGRSWHIFGTFTRVPDVGVSYCGRRLDLATLVDDRPAGKTCESCYRSSAVK